MLVAMLSVGTALTTMGRVKPVAASLTPPTTYDYSYTWNATATEQYFNVNGVDSIPLYTRTADGAYYNYTTTFNVIDGLSVTQTFNRSNTIWQASGTSWKPDEDKIGSDGTVGTITNKVYFRFNNQTNKEYKLFLDFSSGNRYNTLYEYSINGITYNDNNLFYALADALFIASIYIPSYSDVIFRQSQSQANARYFDAWYLQDLGVSAAYQAGLDAETNGILTDYLGTDAQQIGWVLLGIAAILFVMKGGK